MHAHIIVPTDRLTDDWFDFCLCLYQDIKLTFLHEAALHLDKDDTTIAEHVGPVLTEVNDNITVSRGCAGRGESGIATHGVPWCPLSTIGGLTKQLMSGSCDIVCVCVCI